MNYRAPMVAIACLLTAACQYSPDITQRSMAYNEAVAQSTNDLFLQNALRASQRQPTFYTRNQADTAMASISPGLTSTFPASSAPMTATATTVNSNPLALSGFLNSKVITNTVARAALTLTPSFSTTQSNQLTLSNLDDQQSAYGLMAPVSLQQMSNYLKSGYAVEQLYMMYMQNITISRSMLHSLPDAIAENCAVKQHARGPTGNINQYCEYFFRDNIASTFLSDKTQDYVKPKNNPVLAFKYSSVPYDKPYNIQYACFDGGTIHSISPFDTIQVYRDAYIHTHNISKKKAGDEFKNRNKKARDRAAAHHDSAVPTIDEDIDADDSADIKAATPDDTVTFANDPAVDNLDDHGQPLMNSFTCFKQVLTALLTLDLTPTPKAPTALYRVPFPAVQGNPRYFADLTQQGLDIGLLTKSADGTWKPADGTDAADATPVAIGVCKKPDDMSLGFSVDGYVQALFALGGDATLTPQAQPSSITTQANAFALMDVALPPDAKAPPGGSLRAFAFKPSTSPSAIQLVTKLSGKAPAATCTEAVMSWQAAKDKGATLTLTYTPRSLEDMVYFLGQIVRRKADNPASAPVTFLNVAQDPRTGDRIPYEEELFRVVKGAAPPNALARAADASGAYYVPALCDRAVQLSKDPPLKCSEEYPNHASAQVLDVLNQLWGLNKTQVAAPIVPTVTVINP